jgi:hypothetical protein
MDQRSIRSRSVAHQDLTLTLLETRVLLVDHIQLALPSHDLTIGAAFLNGCTNFHDESNFVFYRDHGTRLVPRFMI